MAATMFGSIIAVGQRKPVEPVSPITCAHAAAKALGITSCQSRNSKVLDPFDESISSLELAQLVVNKLTERELEVFHLMGNGIKNKEIARLLNISYNTTHTFRHKIINKLKLSNTMAIGVLCWRTRKELREGLVVRQWAWKRRRPIKSSQRPIDTTNISVR